MNTEDQRLLQAYLQTHFRVTSTDSPFVMRIGQRSQHILELFVLHGVSSAAFLTAWNPASVAQAQEDDARAQQALLDQLSQAGHHCLDGVGEDPVGEWPGEPSVLALGLGREQAELLGRQYGQNAIVWIGPDGVPELVWVKRG